MQEEMPRPRPGVHPFVLVFLVLAIGDLAWYVVNARFPPNVTVSDVVAYALQVVPSVAVVLLPAAILARHRDATWRAPTVVFGAIVFAVAQGMLILSGPLEPLFENLTPPSQELTFLVPLAAIYNAMTSIILAFGVTYLTVGLSHARRFEDRSGLPATLFLPIMAVFGTVVGVVSVVQLDLGTIKMSPTLAVYLGSSVVLGVLRIVVWAYLTTIVWRGWRAGEDPRNGWGLGTLGGGAVILALILVNVGGLLKSTDDTFGSVYAYLTLIAYALGHLLLLAGFLVGLPALDDDDEYDEGGDEDEEDDDDEDDDDFDEDDPGGVRVSAAHELGASADDDL